MTKITLHPHGPGISEAVVRQHDAYYRANWGFDDVFRDQVASDLAEFTGRFDPARDGFWWAQRDGRFAGAVGVDGAVGAEGEARLRWFIVADGCRGCGIGSALIAQALDFCRAAGYQRVFLWTFKGLDAARALYERNGFVLVEEHPFAAWGAPIMEQKFVLEL